MPEFDLLLRNAANYPVIAVHEGRIAGFFEANAAREIDLAGRWLLPGVIDAHVHFNDPGRADWEGIATGSAACAVGGSTVFCDMPLNSHPPTCDVAGFEQKARAAAGRSWVDYAFWGGLIPGNLDELEALRDCGVIGLKAFMSSSGIEDFPKIDPASLRRGMIKAAALGLPVAVHAEIDRPELCQGSTAADYLDSRPISMELEAIRLALELAGETGAALHIVHVSSAEGVALVREAQKRGVDVTCETCPHYLALNRDDVLRLGAVAKCAPPIREEAERAALLAEVLAGHVDTLGSDHSPAPPEMKTDPDFFQVWGGISGGQHLLALLLDLGLPLSLIATHAATRVAERFGLNPAKGALVAGADADFVLIDPDGATEVRAEDLRYRHRQSPYVGRTLRGRVRQTFLRGELVAEDGATVGEPRGQLLRRTV